MAGLKERLVEGEAPFPGKLTMDVCLVFCELTVSLCVFNNTLHVCVS